MEKNQETERLSLLLPPLQRQYLVRVGMFSSKPFVVYYLYHWDDTVFKIFKQILTALIEVTNGHSVVMDGPQILDARARRLSVTSTHVSPAVSTGAQ